MNAPFRLIYIERVMGRLAKHSKDQQHVTRFVRNRGRNKQQKASQKLAGGLDLRGYIGIHT
jgi:hypothetical protein